MMDKKEVQKKLIIKALKMAGNPDDYDAYNKGFVAGQIYLLKQLLAEEQIVTDVTANPDAFGFD